MTFLEAAARVLADAGKPLHSQEICQRAMSAGLLATNGATPEVTMSSRLYTVTKQEGSPFERSGKGMFTLSRKKRIGVDALVAETNARTRVQLHELLAQVPPKRFEALVMDLLLEMGFEESTLEVTPYAKDGGIDVIGTYSAAGLAPVNAAVQVKRWKHNIQAPTVTQLRGSLQVHQFGIIITTSDFSKGARQEAEAPGKTRISLVNGEKLVSLLIKFHIGVVDQPLVVTQLDAEWWGDLIEQTTAAAADCVDEDEPAAVPVKGSSNKPSTVIILGKTVPATTWKAALLAVAEEMARRHPDEFAAVAPMVRGRTRQHLKPTPEGMIAPVAIGNTGFWLETNQSARSVRQVGELIVAAFGHSSSDLQFVVE